MKQFAVRDGHSYLEAVHQIPPKEVNVPVGRSWIDNLAIATTKLATDVILIKSILADAEIAYDRVSSLGNDKVLITFDSKDNLDAFLASKDSLQDFFSIVKACELSFQPSSRLVWLNVFGVPLNLWSLDFFKVIGDECGKYVTVAANTFNRNRLDTATIKVSTSLGPISNCVSLIANGSHFNLRIVETNIDVEMVDDIDDFDADHSVDEEEAVSLASGRKTAGSPSVFGSLVSFQNSKTPAS